MYILEIVSKVVKVKHSMALPRLREKERKKEYEFGKASRMDSNCGHSNNCYILYLYNLFNIYTCNCYKLRLQC